MKKIRLLLSMLLVFILGVSLANASEIDNNVEIYKIDSKRVDCTGFVPQKCLIVNGKYFYDNIKGFDFEEGYKYEIEVKKEKRCNPDIINDCPQDTGIYKYSLVKIISKEIDIPKNCISWYDGCNTCGVKDGKTTYCTKRYCVRHDKPKCLKFKEEVKPIEVTDKLMKKADYLVNRLIGKLEKRYKDNSKREKVIKIIIKKLDSYKDKKPRAIYLIDYINKKLREKVIKYQK